MPLSAPEYWLEWTKNYFICQFTHVGELIHKETWSAASFGWAEGLQAINPTIYRLTTAVSDIDQINIDRDIRDGNRLSILSFSKLKPAGFSFSWSLFISSLCSFQLKFFNNNIHFAHQDLSPHRLRTAFEGVVPKQKFYRPNLIFWIMMEYGIAHFGRKGLKTILTLVSKFVPWDLEGCRTSDLEGRHHRTSRGGASRNSRGSAMAPNLEKNCGSRTIPF